MLVLALLAAAVAVAAPVDLEAEKRELLRLGQLSRTAHLTYDPELLVASQAPGFVSVSEGRISRPSAEQSRAMFRGYFASVTFKAWDDLAPPVVTLSDDATLATVLVQKRVRLTPKDKPDGPVTETDWAWLEIWRKEQGVWRMQMIVSTRQPGERSGDR